MEAILNARTLKAIHRPSDALPCRLFSRMHPFSQALIETQCILLAPAVDRQGFTETDGRSTAWAWNSGVVGQTHWHNSDVNAASMRQLSQPHHTLLKFDRLIVASDVTFGKHHELLAAFQQVNHKSQRCEGGFLLINSEAAESMQKPPLQT
jgi:hypothetical protein